MPFKRPGSGVYYTEVRVGDVALPRLSTGLSDKTSAKQLEAALRTIYGWGYRKLIERVADGKVTLQEIWGAWHEENQRAALDQLLNPHPSIAEDVDFMLDGVTTDERVRVGLRRIKELVPEGADRSWLMEPANVNQLYRDAAKGRDPSTVYRTVHRAVADLLSERLGNGTARRILSDVKVPVSSKRRNQILTAKRITDLVYAAPDDLRAPLALTVLTGIDRGPLLIMQVADWDPKKRHLWVPDAKTHGRPRFLPLEKEMGAWVNFMARNKDPNDSLTGLTAAVLRDRWEALREAQGLPELRWKDLRGVFATWAYQCAWDALRIQMWLGHTNPVMTQRYIKRVQLLPRKPRPVAEAMGIAKVR